MVKLRQSTWTRISALVLFGAIISSSAQAGGPEKELWERWSDHDETSTASISHQIWDRILKSYVRTGTDGVNRFAYSEVTPEDRRALTHYLEDLGKVDVTALNRKEQLAFWINSYNALITNLVVEHYPVENILEIGGNLWSNGPWYDKIFRLGNESLSLHDIEHRIIRPIWHDIRALYLLSCAAVSCPNIPEKAITAATLNGRMDAATMEYINGPVAIISIENGAVRLSKFYQWYAEDFENSEEGILAHLRAFAIGTRAAELQNVGHITGWDFNWDLNDSPAQ